MKHLNTYITEYIVKKKLDKPIDSEDHYEYYPETKQELIDNIKELLNKGENDLNCIDTSKITDMSNLFKSYENINFDISKWNVSNVYNMRGMFHGCNEFDCDLSNWDVSNVENMEGMFRGCKKFKGRGLDKWNPVNLKIIRAMFNDCDIKDKPKWYLDKCYKNKKKSNINYNSFF